MDEYIDREALEIELNHRLSFLMAENGEYDAYTSGFDECVDRVENFQSAFDVAPVVHCKNCRYWDGYNHSGRCEAPVNGLVRENTSANDFCSYGERKGDVEI